MRQLLQSLMMITIDRRYSDKADGDARAVLRCQYDTLPASYQIYWCR